MLSDRSESQALKLSICISTYNRSSFIGETLESILGQLPHDCEVLVLDAASMDETGRVLAEYSSRFDRLRYIRQETNRGIDRDYDCVVEHAHGEFCWLMTDDDLLKPGALAAVLEALRQDPSLVIVNPQSWDFSMSELLQERWLSIEATRIYEPRDMDKLFVELGDALKYIGCVVIRRSLWLARDRQRYYDSLWIHIGVIFQERLPGNTVVIAEPYIRYRWGNGHTWSPKLFEALMVTLPALVWSLPISDSSKNKLCSAHPWRSLSKLVYCRARGCYSVDEFRRWVYPRSSSFREMLAPALIALIPGVIVNTLFVLYLSIGRSRYRGMWQRGVLQAAMRSSRFYYKNLRYLKRAQNSLL